MATDARSVVARLFGAKESGTTAAASPSTGASPAELEALKSQTRKARGKPTKSEQAIVDAQQAADLEALFATENWEVVASMYFDLRFAMTGFDYFKLSEKQERILGSTMGSAMRVLLAIDPRYIALFVFLANFGAFAGEKELAYRHALKQLKAQKDETTNGSRRV